MSSDPLKALKDFSLERKKLMDLDERLQALTQAQETSVSFHALFSLSISQLEDSKRR